MKERTVRKWIATGLSVFTLMGCGEGTEESEAEETRPASQEVELEEIIVVAREENSGTRDAFEDIIGIDEMHEGAMVQQGTEGVIESVTQNVQAIGYVSVGALTDEVKPLSIHDTEASIVTIQSGEYEVYRHFNLAYADELNEVSADFWQFVLSAEGQNLVEEDGYIPADQEAVSYEVDELFSGEITIVGSTSVYPLIESLAKEYTTHQPNVTFDLQATGSGGGVAVAIDGTADIGMASRDLTSEEEEQVGHVETIALDGIAVVVHPDNPFENLSLAEVEGIFSGEIVNWEDLEERIE